MYTTPIFLLAFGLLATVAMARPGKRPWPDHHHENTDNEIVQGHHGHKWSGYRSPNIIRVPRLLADRLGRPWPTFTAKKIFDGKYMVISPALMFRLKDADNDTDTMATAIPVSSTRRPTRPTTEQPIVEETTTPVIDEESTTTASTGSEEEEEEEETTTLPPSFFGKRSFAINNNEQLLFLDD